LDHDGVPWNNNNAEHAVKHFAKYRMITNGQMRASGLESYLVLLSIHQTCVYRGVSFLRFLLSGERDVDAFVESTRRRRGASGPRSAGTPTTAKSGRNPNREAMAAVEEIVRKVAAGEEDPRLQWSRGGRRVRVLFNRAFPDRAVRGPWLYRTLEARLKEAGW